MAYSSTSLGGTDVLGSDADDEVFDLELLGSFTTKIVGVQYYNGSVNRNEMVLLIREPHNPYDRWAIRVDNARNEKVGHIPRTVVMRISPLIDSGKLVIEGTIPYGENNMYSIPLILYCYGSIDHLDDVSSAVNMAGCRFEEEAPCFAPRSLWHPSSPLSLFALSPSSSPLRMRSTPSRGPIKEGQGRSSAPSYSSARRLSASEVAKRVTTMLDNLMKDEGSRPMAEASEVVKTDLYLHQKEALAWMIAKEKPSEDDDLPVFWERRNDEYLHTLCNFSQKDRPETIGGGILADDMGLGKSLTTIALICTNRPNGPIQATDLEIVVDHGVDTSAQRDTTSGKRKASLSKAKSIKSGPKIGKKQKIMGTEQEKADKKRQPTLILCPLTVLGGWIQQFEEHVTPGALKFLAYHGQQRNRKTTFLSGHDVVISTYNILASEFREKSRNGLLGVKWLRVVADEGHILKNTKTQMSQAACMLKAERRWILSGTPIQNSLADLRGLLTFLKFNPLHEPSFFRRTIERPVLDGSSDGTIRLQALVGSLALRRTKESKRDGRPLVLLPRKQVYEINVRFDDDGLAKYLRWKDAATNMVTNHLANQTFLQNYTFILSLILRLRQIAADPSLVSDDELEAMLALNERGKKPMGGSSDMDPERVAKLVETLRDGAEGECSVCLGPLLEPVITPCSHIFCKPCIATVIVQVNTLCPLCRGSISTQTLVELPQQEAETTEHDKKDNEVTLSDGNAAPGPKIAALLERLASCDQRDKHVVFSQFRSMLNLVENGLRDAGIEYFRLDGSTPSNARVAMLKAFSESGGKRVFLVSLKAGGFGLNLTAANHCHILDPWWNPAVEEQAADRVHRLGQTRPVSIWRYITENTIENRMLELQEQKRRWMKCAFDRNRSQDTRAMRINDVRVLMDIPE